MRRLAAFSLVIALVACNGDDVKSDPSTTTAPVDNSTTSESVAPSSTAPAAGSTTSTALPDDNPGSESIGVIEKITITVTDPEG